MKRQIKIENCNNILNGKITIKEKALNIKYGPNGTGKSTISEAIDAASKNDFVSLNRLLPYGKDEKELQPKVSGLTFNKVKVFDEKYVDRYLFEADGFFDNTFHVFLKSSETDQLTEEISNLLSKLRNVFLEDETISYLQTLLPQLFKTIKCSDEGTIKKAGGVNEFLKGNGAGFEHYCEIDDYKPFYDGREMSSISRWAKWRNDGTREIVNNICPFCAGKLEEKIKMQNEIIGKVFKNSALSTANDVLTFLNNAVDSGFINKEKVQIIESYMGDSSKTAELESELQRLTAETHYLNTKIESILSFSPMNVSREQLDNIEENLEGMRINVDYISSFYSTKIILDMVEKISHEIDALKVNTGKLKGLFKQHDKKLQDLIEKREDDIDDFFAIAGFPYQFKLKKDGENKASACICPVGNDTFAISMPKDHLSWGERNAFALVMFMFEAISDDADLVVLDDPVSAFDENKKFAVVMRMFDKKRLSFQGTTVLLFTHNMQPLIDFVHGQMFSRYKLQTEVDAVLIQNNKGIIEEKEIEQKDLINVVDLTKSLAEDVDMNLPVRIVNLRKYIELTDQNYQNNSAYDLLSNLIHHRNPAKDKDGNNMGLPQMKDGMRYIKKFMGDKKYEDLFNELNDENLKKLIDGDNLYSKIISIRLLFERKTQIFSKLKKMAPGACKFINETNHIENDYVFQLDPRKYFSIPENYLENLQSIIQDDTVQ